MTSTTPAPLPHHAAPSHQFGAGGVLSVTNLSSGYGKVVVVRDVSFESSPGEVLGIAGPNGAGKTTLLNAIAGLNRSVGHVALNGTSLDRAAAHSRVRRGLALVPEGRQIIGTLSVRANLDVTAMARGRVRLDEEHERRKSEVLTMFPRLAERINSLGSVLSGGEQQMLAIARALMAHPSVLLLDEPSQGLAPAIVAMVVETLAQLKGSMTIVLVEQNPDVLSALADRTLTLSLGSLAS